MGVFLISKSTSRSPSEKGSLFDPTGEEGSIDHPARHFHSLVEDTTDCIYITDRSGNITYANKTMARRLGYDRDALLNINFFDLVVPEERETARSFFDHLVRNEGEPTPFDVSLHTKTGKVLYFNMNIQPISKEGEHVGYQSIGREEQPDGEGLKTGDGTKETSTEKRFQLFVKNIPAAVAMFDREMRYLAVSDRWLEDYGIEDEHVIGKSQYDVLPHIAEEWRETYQLCLTGITKKSEEDKLFHKDGSMEWVQWEIHPWRTKTGEVGGIVMFTEFITERKDTEMELLKARERAEEASRVKSNFIASMSHEFRTPLNAILGYAELMKNQDNLNADQKKFIDEINRGGKQLLAMINDVIDLSKLETSKIDYREVTFLTESFIDETIKPYLEECEEKGLSLTATLDEGMPEDITTDYEKVREILNELVSNALKFTEEGKIDIEVWFEEVPVSKAGANGRMVVSVSDTGIGISKEQQDKIFKPFSKIQPNYEQGTGLGLTLVRRLCHFMGGNIRVDSKPGTGSRFEFFVPVEASDNRLEKPRVIQGGEQSKRENERTVNQVAEYVQSLDKKDRQVIVKALEMQDLDTISKIEEHMKRATHAEGRELDKLKAAAQTFDFKFLNQLQRLLDIN